MCTALLCVCCAYIDEDGKERMCIVVNVKGLIHDKLEGENGFVMILFSIILHLRQLSQCE